MKLYTPIPSPASPLRFEILLPALLLVAFGGQPLLGVALEVQRVTLPSTFGGTPVQTIDFASDVFVEAGVTPLVFVIPTTRGGNPCTIRFADIRQTGFDAACIEAPAEDGPHVDMDLHYIAIEPGIHSVPATVGGASTTVTLAAGSTATSAVQHGCSSPAACGVEGSTAVSFGTTFSSPPVLLLQIQSKNSESGMPPSTASMPFLTATTVEDAGGAPAISTSGFDVALERSETQQGSVSVETVGWLAVEATSGCTTLDLSGFGGPAAVPFEALVTAEVVDGWADGCNAGEGAAFSAGCFSASPVVVATKRTRNEDDGGWLRRCTNGFSATSALFTVDEDRNSGAGNEGDGERNHVDEAASVLAFGTDLSTPVTLAYFVSEATANGVLFRWTTATEVGNIGFHLYEESAGRRRRLSERLIPSHRITTTEPQSYEVELGPGHGTTFWLSDVDRANRRRDHGPFELGRSYGRAPRPDAIDWAAIRAGHQRRSERAAGHASTSDTGPALPFELHVSRTGIYRVTYEELAAAGLDLAGAPVSAIALDAGGVPQPRRVEPRGAEARFGPGGFLEFFGRSLETSLYTRTNVYRLTLDPEAARPMRRNERGVAGAGQPDHYLERLRIAENRDYSFAAPGGDPWFDRRILAFTQPATEELLVTTDLLADGGATGELRVELWGGTDFPASPDHRVRLAVNDKALWDGTFDGIRRVEARVSLPDGLLREGVNRITLTLPGDTGVAFDLVHLEAYELRYPRAFVARQDRLEFHAQGPAFAVQGFGSDQVVAYRLGGPEADQPTLMKTVVQADSAGGYQVRLRGHPGAERRYWVSTVGALLSPDRIAPARTPAFPGSPARLLLITHGSFLADLDAFVDARRREGYSVQVVDVEDLYARYSHGVVDPEAIRLFIAHAVEALETKFVLLVGGDTYDPLDFTGTGSMSFVPSPYVQTDPLIRFTPSDPLLADVDGDGFPDLPIGRWPVRTSEELAAVVAKTLAYPYAGPRSSAVFAADDAEPMTSFSRISEGLAEVLPEEWTAHRIYLDALDPTAARGELLQALNDGPALVSYFGHSGPTTWTFEGLLSARDAALLTNSQPMVVTQWGCWNTYHVAPAYDTLGHRLLLNRDGGAAAVLGATTLTTVASESRLGPLVVERILTPGQTLGSALQEAKEELRRHAPELLDVLLGWTLLGDPTLEIAR